MQPRKSLNLYRNMRHTVHTETLSVLKTVFSLGPAPGAALELSPRAVVVGFKWSQAPRGTKLPLFECCVEETVVVV